jgi:hypothetical protein
MRWAAEKRGFEFPAARQIYVYVNNSEQTFFGRVIHAPKKGVSHRWVFGVPRKRSVVDQSHACDELLGLSMRSVVVGDTSQPLQTPAALRSLAQGRQSASLRDSRHSLGSAVKKLMA